MLICLVDELIQKNEGANSSQVLACYGKTYPMSWESTKKKMKNIEFCNCLYPGGEGANKNFRRETFWIARWIAC